jgi:hypothetical protein
VSQKTFSLTAGAIFALVTLGHILRVTLGWTVMLGGFAIPAWASWVAIPITGFLAYQGFRLGRKSH